MTTVTVTGTVQATTATTSGIALYPIVYVMRVRTGDGIWTIVNTDTVPTAVYTPPAVSDDASDPYTMLVGDANTVKRFTAADPAITIPTGTYAVKDELVIRQAGTGTLVLTTTGLTINGTIPAWTQHGELKIRYVATDTWDVV